MGKKATKHIFPAHFSSFDQTRRTNNSGNEYWSSRDLAKVLNYSNYRNFEQVISKARISCLNSGQKVGDHFSLATDIVELGNGLKRQVKTIYLSRYACYLLMQNADPTKEIAALGQSYFAIQTRKHELQEQPTVCLVKSVHRIYDALREVTARQSVNQFNVVFALLFYKRISDTSLLSIPQGYCWADIRVNKNPKKLTMILDNMRRILGMHNNSDLYSALNALDIYDIYWEIKPAIQRSIFDIVDKLDLSLKCFGLFEFDSAISGLLEEYSRTNHRNSGEYSNPSWIEELLVKMLEPKSYETIFFPFCKSASIISTFVKASQDSNYPNDMNYNPTLQSNIQGMENNIQMWAFAKLRLTLLGGLSLDISNANSYEMQPKLPPDVVCCIPPFGSITAMAPGIHFFADVPKSRGEIWFLLKELQQSSKKARIGVVVPSGFLYDPALRKVRRYLLEEDFLDAVIELPDKSFYPTTAIKTVLLVLNKSKSPARKHTVAFGKMPTLNKKGELSHVEIEEIVEEYRSNAPSVKWAFASMEDIQRQDYNLIPSTYHEGLKDELDALLQNKNGKRLDEICQIIRGRARKPIEDNMGLPFISTKDLSGEVTDPYLDFGLVTLSKPEALNQIVTKKCILVSLVGRSPKATIYDPQRAYKSDENELFEGILINPNIVCIIPREDIIGFEYLYYQLNTPLFTKQYDYLHRGVGVPHISLPEFRSIIIPVLDLGHQREITRQTKEALLIEANAKLEALKANLNVEEEKQEAEFQIVSHLAHNLSPRLNSVTSTLKHLYEFLEVQELLQEPLQNQYYEGQLIELVGDAISKARQDVTQMVSLIKDTKKVITEEIKAEDFRSVNLAALFNKIKTKYSNRNFSLDVKCDDGIDFTLHETTFAEMVDNFIRNAEVHGFTDKNTPHLIVISAREEKSNLVVDIKNNGLPLPDELTVEKFLSFGGKRTNSPGDGLGGAYIDKVIRAHAGTLQINRLDKQYSTCFRISFPFRRHND